MPPYALCQIDDDYYIVFIRVSQEISRKKYTSHYIANIDLF